MSAKGTGANPNIASYMILKRGDKFAFLLRQNTSWMNGYYSLPSGRVEENESFIQAAMREVKEELGVDVTPQNVRHALMVPKITEDNQYWIDGYFYIDEWTGEAHNAEPHVHGSLEWFSIHELPENTVPNVIAALQEIEKGNVYYEHGF